MNVTSGDPLEVAALYLCIRVATGIGSRFFTESAVSHRHGRG
jgi:hypothetical protein